MFILGHVICRNSFMYYNNIGKSRLNSLASHYKMNGAVPRQFLYKGRNKKAIDFTEAKRIVDFVKNVATIHALSLPGRVSGSIITITIHPSS